MIIQYNGTPLVSPPLFYHKKCDLSRGVASKGRNKHIYGMLRFTLSIGFSKGGGISSGCPLKKDSIGSYFISFI